MKPGKFVTFAHKYEAIPAELEYEDVGIRDKVAPPKRSAYRNCIIFGLPLILLAFVTWILVAVSSNKSVDLARLRERMKSNVKRDSEITIDCWIDCPLDTSFCTNTSTAVLGGLDFVDFYTKTAENSRGMTYTAGKSSISATYGGYSFYFSTEANKILFESSPTTYVPQFGGFCAWGIGGEMCPDYAWDQDCLGPSGDWSLGYKYGGKLYFFFGGKHGGPTTEAMENFLADADKYVAQGDIRWEAWFGSSSGAPKTVFSTNCYVNPSSSPTSAVTPTSPTATTMKKSPVEIQKTAMHASLAAIPSKAINTVKKTTILLGESNNVTLDCSESCPSKMVASDCMNTDTAVLGGLDFVHYYIHTSENTQGVIYTAGKSSISSVYQGYTFYFSTEANKILFERSPTTYVPQFGGFCAWGIGGEMCPDYAWDQDCLGPSGDWSLGYKYGGKLYFFYKAEAMEKFLADTDTYVAQGDIRWEGWFGSSSGAPKTVFSTNCYVNPSSSPTSAVMGERSGQVEQKTQSSKSVRTATAAERKTASAAIHAINI